MAGVSRNGEHLYPALPYTSYCRMSVKDVRDLFAFLRTTPPVSGRAPPNALIFPFSIRRAVGYWKLLYMPRIDPPAVDPTGEEALGRYLVNGPGHCAECHSPRDFLGGVIELRRLTGGLLPDGKGKAPEHHRAGPQKLVGKRHIRRTLDRLHPVGRRARQRDDRGGPQPLARAGERPRGDRPLPQDIQARRGAVDRPFSTQPG